MKIIRFQHEGFIGHGVVEGDRVFRINGSIFGDFSIHSELCKLSDVRLLAPVSPKIVVGIGANYRDHVAETGMDLPEEPVIFFKPTSSVVGHLEPVIYPKISRQVNYAGELAVVMKRRTSCVDESAALEYVLGFTCGNDITAADLFLRNKLSQRAKAVNTFCPLGPCIATDVVGKTLNLKSRLNGVLMQDDITSNMIFGISEIISFVSEFMVLEPGDVIITGSSRRGSTDVKVGDTMEIEIEGVGLLRNTIAADSGD